MKDAAISYLKPSSPSDPQVLALFQDELARIAARPGLAVAPALLPRFVGYYQGLARLPRRLRRQLQRRWRRSLAAIALLLALGQAPALAATLTVAPDIAPAIASDGSCSLIEAIENANTDSQTHADCRSGSGADTIALPESSIQLLTQIHNNTYGDTGLPVIRSVITIEGNGSLIFDAASGRIFAVNSTGNLSLNETTVGGGNGEDGGGIFVFSGGRLTITNSTVSGNSASSFGGGVYNDGTVTLTNSTVSGNSASSFGGGVANFGNATLTNSTVSGNRAISNGGGVFNFGNATLTNSTVSGNIASVAGGGVYHGAGTTTLTRSLVSGNTATPGAEVARQDRGTVIANNFNLFGHSSLTNDQAFSGFTPGPNDRTATSTGTTPPTALGAILETMLADNGGGPTRTHALIAGSPAVDAVGTGCPPPATDQRGVSRPQGPACDIGAFERAIGSTDVGVSLADIPDPMTVGQTLAYTITVRNNGPSQATGVRLTDSLPQGVLVDSRPSQCAGTDSIICNLGTLASGAVATVTITVIPTVPGTVGNTVSVVANEPDPNPANDSATETTTVQPPSSAQADLAITAAATPDPGTSGQTLTYTLAVRNNGPSQATGVQVTDILPAGVVLAFKPSECEGSTTVICNLGTLPSGGEATVTIDVIPTTAGTLTHGPRVTGIQTDPNPANNAFSVTTTVEPPLEPTSQATCSTLRCTLRLACNQAASLGNDCENDVTLFVRAPSARLRDEVTGRAPKRMIRFAAAVTNIPPGRTEKVRFNLTKKGKQTAKKLIQQGKRKLRGVMEIRNTAGGTDTIRITLRLK